MMPAEPKQDSANEKPAPPKRVERGEQRGEPETLDFAKLDLSVEKVEERIAPSETNVFDK